MPLKGRRRRNQQFRQRGANAYQRRAYQHLGKPEPLCNPHSRVHKQVAAYHQQNQPHRKQQKSQPYPSFSMSVAPKGGKVFL